MGHAPIDTYAPQSGYERVTRPGFGLNAHPFPFTAQCRIDQKSEIWANAASTPTPASLARAHSGHVFERRMPTCHPRAAECFLPCCIMRRGSPSESRMARCRRTSSASGRLKSMSRVSECHKRLSFDA